MKYLIILIFGALLGCSDKPIPKGCIKVATNSYSIPVGKYVNVDDSDYAIICVVNGKLVEDPWDD